MRVMWMLILVLAAVGTIPAHAQTKPAAGRKYLMVQSYDYSRSLPEAARSSLGAVDPSRLACSDDHEARGRQRPSPEGAA